MVLSNSLNAKKQELRKLLTQVSTTRSFESVDLTRRISQLTAEIREEEQSEHEHGSEDEEAQLS